MEDTFKALKARLDGWVWRTDYRELRGFSRSFFHAVRLIYVVVRDLVGGELNLRAMSLVYTTLLAVIPLLAVSFTVLKAFGVHNEVAPLLNDFLAPLGQRGEELAKEVIAFVENVQVGFLGVLGVTLLMYTAVSLMHKVEAAINFVWHIKALRSFARRVSNFLAVILIGPMLVLSALAITTTTLVKSLESVEIVAVAIRWGAKLLPYVLVWIAFSFIYLSVPNTRVRFKAAAIGGLIAGILWQTTALGFGAFIASSARYDIYKGFAVLVLLLIWLYLNWLVLLVGAQISFYVQNPHYLTRMPLRLALSNRLKERLAMTVMYLVGYNHFRDRPPWTIETLSDHLELPSEPVQTVLNLLRDQGFLEQTAEDPPGYLPARDIATIDIRGLLKAVRRAEESRFLNASCFSAPAPVEEIAATLTHTVDGALASTTVRDLIPERPSTEPTSLADRRENA